MFNLKPIHPDGIHAALEKAEHYRLLNEPWEAQSICEDVLAIDEDNQQALVTLLLSLTDQFGKEMGANMREARALLPRIEGEYEQAYYAGMIAERRAKAHLHRGGPGFGEVAYEMLREAMEQYERAESLSPAGNDDAILRWNTCARILSRHSQHLKPVVRDRMEHQLE